jgi:hypothetical protein
MPRAKPSSIVTAKNTRRGRFGDVLDGTGVLGAPGETRSLAATFLMISSPFAATRSRNGLLRATALHLGLSSGGSELYHIRACVRCLGSSAQRPQAVVDNQTGAGCHDHCDACGLPAARHDPTDDAARSV